MIISTETNLDPHFAHVKQVRVTLDRGRLDGIFFESPLYWVGSNRYDPSVVCEARKHTCVLIYKNFDKRDKTLPQVGDTFSTWCTPRG